MPVLATSFRGVTVCGAIVGGSTHLPKLLFGAVPSSGVAAMLESLYQFVDRPRLGIAPGIAESIGPSIGGNHSLLRVWMPSDPLAWGQHPRSPMAAYGRSSAINTCGMRLYGLPWCRENGFQTRASWLDRSGGAKVKSGRMFPQ